MTIPAAVAVNGLREGFSATVSAPSGGSNGSATIHAVEPGVAKITVTASGAAAAAAGDYDVMAEPQAEQTGSASFYLTVAEGAVEVQTESKFYRLAVQMKEGGKYMLVCGKGEGDAYALLASDAEGVRTIGKKDVRISVYNSAIPYVLAPSGTEDTAIWTFNSVNQETGEGFLNNNGRTDAYNRLAFAVPTGDWSSPEVMDIQTNPGSYGWKYSFDEGLHCTTGGRTWFLTRLYDERTPSSVVNEWAVVRNDRHDTNFYFDVYAYEETPLTYTLTLSDMRGEVAENSTDTGTMIVKTWATGKVEYIPLTTAHLSVGSDTAGTYNNVTVTYDGVEICGDYTLVVGNVANTITMEEPCIYYRLTNSFEQGKFYLIVNENAEGAAVILGGEHDSHGVIAVPTTIDLDADGIPCVRISDGTKLAFKYRTKDIYGSGSAATYNVLAMTQFETCSCDYNSAHSFYLRGSQKAGGNMTIGLNDSYMLIDQTVRKTSFTDQTGAYTSLYANAIIEGTTYNYYLQYEPVIGIQVEGDKQNILRSNEFRHVLSSGRKMGSEIYIYEEVKDYEAEVAALGTIGGVDSGSAADAKTGTYVQITYPDGHVENTPVTVNMLSKNGTALTAADIADKSSSFELTGLTLKYQGVTLTTNYTLKVRDSDTDPVHPEPGSVEVDKQKDTTEYNYEETGVARVDLSVSGVPMSKPVDVLLIVDTSASVEMYRMENGQTRIQAMRDATAALIDELAQPNADGSLPDISLAISEFNNYTYFGAPNTFTGNDDTGKPYEPFGYTNYNKNNVIQDYTSIYEMQNFNPAVLVPKSGTNYDVAFQVAYETVKKRQEQHPEREQIVIFMTDGICYQYNYMSYRTDTPSSALWGKWLMGTLEEPDKANLPAYARDYFYNGDGNVHRMAAAVKGSPETKYDVVWQDSRIYDGVNFDPAKNWREVNGLGATVYSIGFGIYVDGEEAVAISDHILGNMASDPYKFFKAQETEDLMAAFADIGHGVRKAATNAKFYDQMGEEFDLRMKPVVNSKGEAIAKRPTIQVKSYDVYKYGEIGTVINGVTVTEDMVGERKSNVPTILETVTFSDDGTKAYSDRKTGNIMLNGIIDAHYFKYNTMEYNPDDTGSHGTPGPETFLWNIGEITERELVLSYYVYLEKAMGEAGGHTAGVYDTNQYARLEYKNYNGELRTQETVSPELDWETARVKYGFYLVDENGKPIKQDGSGTDYANKVQVGSFSAGQSINLNTDNTVTPKSITLSRPTRST